MWLFLRLSPILTQFMNVLANKLFYYNYSISDLLVVLYLYNIIIKLYGDLS